MVELSYNPVQSIPYGQGAIFNTVLNYSGGYVIHREGSGIITLRWMPHCMRRQPNTLYQCTFVGNIALPEGATPGEIAIALAIAGEAIPTSTAIVTPTAVDTYFNVTSTAIIPVIRGCCNNIELINISTGATTNPTINMQNANMVITTLNV